VRVPLYVRNKSGVIIDYCGPRLNPERLAYGEDGLPRRDLYLLRFRQADLWPDYPNQTDTLMIEIYDHWLEPEDADAR
jgi:nitrile hydratase subunit beta